MSESADPDALQADREEPGRGRAALSPRRIPWKGWIDIAWRVGQSFFGDRVMFVAGGVTFFTLLSLFPALAAFVSLYGLFADVTTAVKHFQQLSLVLPDTAVSFVGGELMRLAARAPGGLGLTFVGSLLFSIWSANGSVRTLVYGLNVAYHETEKRNLLTYSLLTLAFTVGGLIFVMALTALIVAAPIAMAFLGLSEVWARLEWIRWPALLGAYWLMLSVLYRYGPCRSRARWRWLTPGGLFATVGSVAASALFSFWLSRIANFDATYGSLGAVMGFMLWTWISVIVILIGAELNAEVEHQTAVDSTTGAPAPMGKRGAIVADTLGPKRGDPAIARFTLDHAMELSRRMIRRKPRRGP